VKILETERLILREITVDDAAFVLDLLNQPSFIKYIGDRGVHDLDQSRDFIENRYRKSYRDHGYGLYVVELKEPLISDFGSRSADLSEPGAVATGSSSIQNPKSEIQNLPGSPPYEGGVAGFSSPPGLRRGADASSAGWSADRGVLPQSIGFCGFVRRSDLPAPDIGFAFLPQYERKGYGFESASAILQYGVEKLNFDVVLAITSQDNESSGKLLKKLGFNYDRLISMPNGEVLKLFRFVAHDLDKIVRQS